MTTMFTRRSTLFNIQQLFLC